jgi:hypothetical protein
MNALATVSVEKSAAWSSSCRQLGTTARGTRGTSNGGMTMDRTATRQRGQITSRRRTGTNNVPIKLPLTEDVATQRFAATISGFPVGDISTAGKITKEAAKKYQQGHSMPRSVPLINMAREIPEVRAWLYAEIESGSLDSMESPRAMDALVRLLLKHLQDRT